MERSSFFNSVLGDRKYTASDFAEYFSSLLTNGVFPNPGTNLQVVANNGMTVTLKAGPAWIKGYRYTNSSDLVLTIDNAESILKRIDRVVIKMDNNARNITAAVKKGTPASAPVAPALQRDADVYELGIADIYVGAGVTTIVGANITDLRMNTTFCGWVNSIIQADTTTIFDQYQAWYSAKQATYDAWYTQMTQDTQVDVDALEAQMQSDFDTWFAGVQSQLSGDVAGNLLTQINERPHVFRGAVEPASPTAIDFWFKEV